MAENGGGRRSVAEVGAAKTSFLLLPMINSIAIRPASAPTFFGSAWQTDKGSGGRREAKTTAN